MAAGKWKLYDFAKKYIGDGTHDLDVTTNMQVALFLSTSNANTLSVGTGIYGDLTNEHANANGYTTGGVALTGETWTRSGDTTTYDANDPVWTASGGSIVAVRRDLRERDAERHRETTAGGVPLGHDSCGRDGDHREHAHHSIQRLGDCLPVGRDLGLMLWVPQKGPLQVQHNAGTVG